MNSPARPRATKVSPQTLFIQSIGNLCFRLSVIDKRTIYPSNGLDLVRWPWHQDNTIGLNTLVLSSVQLAL